MQHDQFNFQVQRLNDTYNNVFNKERSQLLWRDIKNKSSRDFNKVVDRLLSTKIKTITINDVLYEFTKAKERKYNYEKANSTYQPSSISDVEAKDRMRIIMLRMDGKYPDAEWVIFQKHLKASAAKSKNTSDYDCAVCSDSGWRQVGSNLDMSVKKCTCEKGRSILLPVNI